MWGEWRELSSRLPSFKVLHCDTVNGYTIWITLLDVLPKYSHIHLKRHHHQGMNAGDGL
jgi:hypothetical protein